MSPSLSVSSRGGRDPSAVSSDAPIGRVPAGTAGVRPGTAGCVRARTAADWAGTPVDRAEMKDDGGDVLNATALFKMPAGRSELGACCPSAVADLNHKESDHKLNSFQKQIGGKTSSILGFSEKCALAFL